MISTPWSRSVGLTAPILNAPMGGVAGSALATAVSQAGGLGMIGMGSAGSLEALQAQLRGLGRLDRPFGIGLLGWAVETEPQLLSAALDARPTLVSVSFGDDWGWIRHTHDAGVLAATQVAEVGQRTVMPQDGMNLGTAARLGLGVAVTHDLPAIIDVDGGAEQPSECTQIGHQAPFPEKGMGGQTTGRALADHLAAIVDSRRLAVAGGQRA